MAEIEAVARGRVWTGRDALEAGLVDELGGLRDAVRIARERADLPEDAPVLGAIRIPPLARLSSAQEQRGSADLDEYWFAGGRESSVSSRTSPTSPLLWGCPRMRRCGCPTSRCVTRVRPLKTHQQ